MEIQRLSSTVVTGPSNLKGRKGQKISSFDKHLKSATIPFAYYYRNDEKDDQYEEKLVKGLKVVFEEYPEFAGSFQCKENEWYTHCNNKGAIVVKSLGNFTYSDVEKLNYCLEIPETKLFLEENDDDKSYLTSAHLIELKDRSLIVAVRISHGLCDLHGVFRFLNAWGEAARTGEVGMFTNHTNRDLVHGNGKPIMTEKYRGDTPFSSMPRPASYQVASFFVPYGKLDDLKAEFSKDLSPGQFLSKNDILTGIIWKAFLSTRLHRDNEYTTCVVHKNCRKNFDLDDSYIGNCSVLLAQRLRTEDVHKQSLKDVCLKIRSFYSVVTKDYLMDDINWLERDGKDSMCFFNHVSGNEFVFSSIATYPLYGFDFGLGKPGYVTLSRHIPVGTTSILPVSKGDGVEVLITLEADEMETFFQDTFVKSIFVFKFITKGLAAVVTFD